MSAFHETFRGSELDTSVWTPTYIPAWSSRAALAATYVPHHGRARSVSSRCSPESVDGPTAAVGNGVHPFHDPSHGEFSADRRPMHSRPAGGAGVG